LSKASNSAKVKWNAANYAQVKAFINPELAASFKATCANAGVSMASVLSQLMAEYCAAPISKKTTVTNPVSTKKKRRNTVRALIHQLEQVRDAEEQAKENIPENLRGAGIFDASEESVSLLEEAIEILEGVY
jgi:hypothetical protein